MTEPITTIDRDAALEAAETYRKAFLAIEKINSAIKADQARIAAKYESDLGKYNDDQKAASIKLEEYLNENRDELLADKKSTGFAGLTVGFRKATAKLVLHGKTTWDKVLGKLKDSDDLRETYLKVKEEIDKTKLKTADVATLKQLGVKIEQTENFFVKI